MNHRKTAAESLVAELYGLSIAEVRRTRASEVATTEARMKIVRDQATTLERRRIVWMIRQYHATWSANLAKLKPSDTRHLAYATMIEALGKIMEYAARGRAIPIEAEKEDECTRSQPTSGEPVNSSAGT